MHKVLLRFRLMKNNRIIEVFFDSRLSFKENFEYLNNIYGIDKDFYVFDDNKKLFLDIDIPINDFNFNSFMTLNLY